jgi:hypothetical protein
VRARLFTSADAKERRVELKNQALSCKGQSPIKHYKALRFDPAYAELTKNMQLHVRRIADVKVLTPRITEVLDEERAPFKVIRWVAWGRWLEDRMVRLALALFVRREVNPEAPSHADPESGWAWATDSEHGVAEKMWFASPARARLVKARLLTERGKLPNTDVTHMHWDRMWNALQGELEAMDRRDFQAQVRAVDRARSNKRRVRRVPIGPETEKTLAALEHIKKLVRSGELVSLGDLEAETERRAQRRAQGKAPGRTRNGKAGRR